MGILKLPDVQEGYDFLWSKTVAAMKYIFENYLNDIKWILKADDDTYVIMENLRFFLRNYSWNDSHFFGSIYEDIWVNKNHHYNSGGPGYILSKAALEKFVSEGLNHSQCTKTDLNNTSSKNETQKSKKIAYRGEDIEIANCLRLVGIVPEDTRDDQNRSRFFQRVLEYYLYPLSDYKKANENRHYQLKNGAAGVSDSLISFHRVTPRVMYLFDFLLYQVNPLLQAGNSSTL